MMTANFTYESNVGNKFNGRIECRDFDEAMDVAEKIADWCSSYGFRFLRCYIYDNLSIEEEHDEV